MTLPLFLALHLVYGTVIGTVLFPRMRADGEVLGPPLLLSLVPVAFVSAPIGAIFLRYSGGWFLHGALVGTGNVTYERFHFGLLLAVVLCAGLVTVAGVFNVAIWASRGKPALAKSGLYVAAVIALVVFGLDFDGVIVIKGTGGRWLWTHPVGLLSLASMIVLGAWVEFCRRRFSAVPPQAGPGTGVPRSHLAGPLL